MSTPTEHRPNPVLDWIRRNKILTAIIAGLLVLGLLVAINNVRTASEETKPSPTSEAVAPGPGTGPSSSETATPTATTTTGGLSPGKAKQAYAPEEDAWRETAAEFGKAWANPAGGKKAWLARMKPMVSEEEYQKLEKTNERSLRKYTYEKVTAERTDYENMRVVADVSYQETGPYLRVGLAPTANGKDWQVQYISQAD